MIFENVVVFFVYDSEPFWGLFWALLASLDLILAVSEAICVLKGSIGRQALFHRAFWTHFFIRAPPSGHLGGPGFAPQIDKSCNWKHKHSEQNQIASKIQCKAHNLIIFRWFSIVFSFKNLVNNGSVAQPEHFRFWTKNLASRHPKESFSAPWDALWRPNRATRPV